MAHLTKRIVFSAVAAVTAGVALVASAVGAGPGVGDKAPDFTLTDVEGNEHRLSDFEGKVVVLEWFNPDCPFVKKFHKNSRVMAETVAAWQAEMDEEGNVTGRGDAAEEAGLDVVFLAVNSGAPGKQGYGVDRNRKAVTDYAIQYPVLLDDTGVVGKKYGAKKTPEIFIIDEEGMIIYHGPIDNTGSARKLGDTNYVRTALSQHAAGETVITPKIAPYGCGVKYAKK